MSESKEKHEFQFIERGSGVNEDDDNIVMKIQTTVFYNNFELERSKLRFIDYCKNPEGATLTVEFETETGNFDIGKYVEKKINDIEDKIKEPNLKLESSNNNIKFNIESINKMEDYLKRFQPKEKLYRDNLKKDTEILNARKKEFDKFKKSSHPAGRSLAMRVSYEIEKLEGNISIFKASINKLEKNPEKIKTLKSELDSDKKEIEKIKKILDPLLAEKLIFENMGITGTINLNGFIITVDLTCGSNGEKSVKGTFYGDSFDDTTHIYLT